VNLSLFGLLMFWVALSVLVAGPAQTTALRVLNRQHPDEGIRHPYTARDAFVFVSVYLAIGAVAAAIGILCIPVTGLHSPVFESMAAFKPFWQGLNALLVPALLAGAVASLPAQAATFILLRANPENGARMLSSHYRLTFAGRIFTGGIFEEIVFRFGVVQLAAWAAIRLGVPAVQAAWAGVVVSGLVAAVADSAAHRFIGLPLPRPMIGWVIARQVLLAFSAGALFITYGLFAAMVAHIAFLLVQQCVEILLRWTQTGRA